MENITNNFKWSEFIVSSRYPELAKKIYLNPSDKQKTWFLTSTILQPLRTALAKRIIITSGKRSPELNIKVSGSPTSDHLFKNLSVAADFTILNDRAAPEDFMLLKDKNAVDNTTMRRAWGWLRMYCGNSIGQLIWYKEKNIMHVSLPTPKHHRKFMRK